jgi:hypothetical protein
VEKIPLGEGVQRSELGLGWILIFWISLTLEGSNREVIRGRFHTALEVMRSDMTRFVRVLGKRKSEHL